MTISYNWLSEYLPEKLEPEKLSKILTAVGLEVESLEKYESLKGGLQGVVVGEVLECFQHPNADKLKVTKVNIGGTEPLNIVCGANNVAAGQKVLVATVGSTIYPTVGDPITLKAAKIRGEESQGMICAEDELGLGTDHAGIIVLPENIQPGTPGSDYLNIYNDWIYEIGLTPNRMDAMSHFGVAKDVCAYLTHHNKTETRPKSPFNKTFKVDSNTLPVTVTIENTEACERYSGVSISGVSVTESPQWLKDKLLSIGQRPINNIVDITNYILHETGQPLHAFDLDEISGRKVIVKTLPGSAFTTLDEKERQLHDEDLMICNEEGGMCIAGVFGGLKSGVKNTTSNIFLESAWFNPVSIRRTSFRHGLRTEAATRFEKGVDISNVVTVLKRAALLIKEVAGGIIASDVVDVYPNPKEKTQVAIKYHYLKKLSGKNYHPDAVKRILTSLGFEIIKEGMDELWVAVPFSKPDISLPADIVEEILRIDGLDNIEFPAHMTYSPAIDPNITREVLKEKISGFLVGLGFHEIMTNSITNSQYYNESQLPTAVKMINNLSADLDVMRVSMLETGLETIAYNVNRRNTNLSFFEFGKTYHSSQVGNYTEVEHLALYLTGKNCLDDWAHKAAQFDIYKAKGIAEALLQLNNINSSGWTQVDEKGASLCLELTFEQKSLVKVAEVATQKLKPFDIKQPVFFLDFNWPLLIELVSAKKITFKEVPKYPVVERDLAIVINKEIAYSQVETVINKGKNNKLQQVRLFDVFESEKLGAGKKSFAINFTFLDEEKTLTDKEIDAMMNKMIQSFERELQAEIRK